MHKTHTAPTIKKVAFFTTLLLLLLNGTGAVYGGYNLITDPSGGNLHMPLSFLQHSPFQNYLIPGIILFLVNGVLSFLVITALLVKHRQAHRLVILQGALLAGWIAIQIIMLQTFYPPMHLPFFMIGVLLVGCGMYLQANR